MPEQLVAEQRIPRITAAIELHWERSDGKKMVLNEELQFDWREFPMAVQDEVSNPQFVGNGLARVGISADMGIKRFGTGASAMATVTLTCNQDLQTIERAAGIAGDLARQFAQEQRQRAETELQAILDQRGWTE